MPSVTAHVKVGNCANMSFLLTSLVRQEMPEDKVYCVLGNLHNGKPGGHAWTEVKLGSNDYIMEATKSDVPPLVLARVADRYEAVHLFNDKEVLSIEGRTVMTPYAECYSTWLSDYLDWSYIEGGK